MHTHSSVCHFLISCCSVLKPLHPPCREQTLCSFLFVMVITLSLTVPHFACQLAFIYFFFLFSFPFSGMYCQLFLGYVSDPPCIARRSWNQLYYVAGALSILMEGRTDKNLDLSSVTAASHLHNASDPAQILSVLALLSLSILSNSSLHSFSFGPWSFSWECE